MVTTEDLKGEPPTGVPQIGWTPPVRVKLYVYTTPTLKSKLSAILK
jgi:hypothetical protein